MLLLLHFQTPAGAHPPAIGLIPNEMICLLCRRLTTTQNHFSSMCTNIICFFFIIAFALSQNTQNASPNEPFYALLGDQVLGKYDQHGK